MANKKGFPSKQKSNAKKKRGSCLFQYNKRYKSTSSTLQVVEAPEHIVPQDSIQNTAHTSTPQNSPISCQPLLNLNISDVHSESLLWNNSSIIHKNITEDTLNAISDNDVQSFSLQTEVSNDNFEVHTVSLSGRRIVDINHIFKQIQNSTHNGGLDCSFMSMVFVSEKRCGFFSKFKFQCQMCNIETIIFSEPTNETYLPINKAVINGTVAIGIGQTQLFELSSALEIPCMANSTFSRQHEELSSNIHNLAWDEIRKAGEEERQLAIEAGDIDVDGIPFCSVVADGQWSKRSYKTKYDSLSGVATIIGFKTKKVLFIGIRNRYCVICNRAEIKNVTPIDHTCFLNWTKSATGMEADGVAEGFLKSVDLHNMKFKRLIGDGDSSVTKRLKEILPYGSHFLVEKIECRNHMLRNYMQKLTAIAKKTNYPIELRKFILRHLMRFRTAIVRAIRYRKNENVSQTQQISSLAKDVYNTPYHIMGQHSNCDTYFCNKKTLADENLVLRAENCGMMIEINTIINRLVINSKSLILDLDNNICEQFNSLINKYIGGKRINLSQRNAYNARVEAAVIAFNSKQYLRAIMKNITTKSPGQFGKKFLKDANRKRLNNTKRRELFPTTSKNRNKKSGPDENYGLAEELPEDNICPEELEKQKVDFINKLREIDIDNLEKDTREQAKSPLWFSERRKRITASRVGKISKMRPYTSCKKTVHELLYGELNYKIKSIEYGRVMETVAKQKFEEIFNLTIKPVGLCVDENVPYIAASPDGLIGDESIIEIKCPFSAKTELNIFEAIKNGKISFCQIDDKKCVTLKTNHDYYYQIQTQLHVTKRTKCYFFIFTENWSYNIFIFYDVNFWNTKIKLQLDLFYNECLLPELISPLFGKRLLVSDIREPVRILREQETRKKIKGNSTSHTS